jgi:hypothetical protein
MIIKKKSHQGWKKGILFADANPVARFFRPGTGLWLLWMTEPPALKRWAIVRRCGADVYRAGRWRRHPIAERCILWRRDELPLVPGQGTCRSMSLPDDIRALV